MLSSLLLCVIFLRVTLSQPDCRRAKSVSRSSVCKTECFRKHQSDPCTAGHFIFPVELIKCTLTSGYSEDKGYQYICSRDKPPAGTYTPPKATTKAKGSKARKKIRALYNNLPPLPDFSNPKYDRHAVGHGQERWNNDDRKKFIGGEGVTPGTLFKTKLAPDSIYEFIVLVGEKDKIRYYQAEEVKGVEPIILHWVSGHTSLLTDTEYKQYKDKQSIVHFAGRLHTNDKGKIFKVDNWSGHFQPCTGEDHKGDLDIFAKYWHLTKKYKITAVLVGKDGEPVHPTSDVKSTSESLGSEPVESVVEPMKPMEPMKLTPMKPMKLSMGRRSDWSRKIPSKRSSVHSISGNMYASSADNDHYLHDSAHDKLSRGDILYGPQYPGHGEYQYGYPAAASYDPLYLGYGGYQTASSEPQYAFLMVVMSLFILILCLAYSLCVGVGVGCYLFVKNEAKLKHNNKRNISYQDSVV